MHKSNLDVITVIEPNSSIWPLTPREFWQWREAFFRLVIKEYQIRFRDTYLGFIWVILQPLIALLILLPLMKVGMSAKQLPIPYSAYLLSGLVVWTFVTNGFSQGSSSLVDHHYLITQTNLKRCIIPLSVLCSKFVDLAVGLIFLLIWISLDSRVSLCWKVLYVPVDIFGLFLLLVGITFFFSALCVNFRDIRYIVPFLAQILFFATPVVYALDLNSFVLWKFNPFTIYFLALRDHLFGTNFVTMFEYFINFVYTAIIFVVGCLVFKKFEKTLADMI